MGHGGVRVLHWARAQTERDPFGLKWIDTNKGSAEAPRYRSRLVCTEVRHKGVEPIFSATSPLETLRILLGVACQEDVFRVEDPMLITTSMLMRCVTSTSDCRVRTPKRNNQVCVGNCERRCMVPWMRHTDGESISLKFWWLEDAPVAWRLRATSSTKTWKRTFWYTAMIFFIVGRQKGREHVLRLLRSACELSKVVTLGPGPSKSRTATILGRTLTLRQWGIEYEPDHQHVSRALKALGLTGAKGVGTPGTDDVGGPKASEVSELRKTAKWHNPFEERTPCGRAPWTLIAQCQLQAALPLCVDTSRWHTRNRCMMRLTRTAASMTRHCLPRPAPRPLLHRQRTLPIVRPV